MFPVPFNLTLRLIFFCFHHCKSKYFCDCCLFLEHFERLQQLKNKKWREVGERIVDKKKSNLEKDKYVKLGLL